MHLAAAATSFSAPNSVPDVLWLGQVSISADATAAELNPKAENLMEKLGVFVAAVASAAAARGELAHPCGGGEGRELILSKMMMPK